MYTGKMFQTGKTGKLMHNWNSNDFPVDESIFQPQKIYWTYQVWNNKKKDPLINQYISLFSNVGIEINLKYQDIGIYIIFPILVF